MHLTETRCWLFKEADAPSLGWEVYAMRERVGREDGIVLVANASKLLERELQPGQFAEAELEEARDSLDYAVEDFLKSIRLDRPAASGAEEGFRAVVMAEAAQRSPEKGGPVGIDPQEFEIS